MAQEKFTKEKPFHLKPEGWLEEGRSKLSIVRKQKIQKKKACIRTDYGASWAAQLMKNRLQCRRPWLDSWVGKIPWRRDRISTPVFLGFPCSSAGKESTCHVGDLGLIPGLGRSPGKGKGYPLQYSGLENSTDCIAYVVTKSRTQLSNFHFHFLSIREGMCRMTLSWKLNIEKNTDLIQYSLMFFSKLQ